ncbi:MAG: hypothetical protein RL653_3759 [Pseudomonadota bacterium]
MKILVMAHGHPSLSKGGAELAAHASFDEMRRRGHDCVLVSATSRPSHGGATFSQVAPGELLLHTAMSDAFLFRSTSNEVVETDFKALLQRLRPDVVHLHHYVNVGLNTVAWIRSVLPGARIVMTLHEYLAICLHNGQMVKTGTFQLCETSSPAACHQCFPERSPADFFLRRQFILGLLRHVDRFVSPSAFLRDRYVAWGLPPEKIVVVENGQRPVARLPPRPLREGEGRGRFAFLGQVNPYKGVDLLLKAVLRLSPEARSAISVSIHGANLELQQGPFQQAVKKLLDEVSDVVSWQGPYEPSHLPAILAGVDWVVVPSTWWENSPLVIQETLSFGRPVIASDIGGMAEKVVPGRHGRQFRARDPLGLASEMEAAWRDVDGYAALVDGLPVPPTLAETTKALEQLYT